MSIIEKVTSIFKAFKVMLLALLFGVLIFSLLVFIHYRNIKDEFKEIKDLPRSTIKNKQLEENFPSLTNIYDFNKQSIGIDVSSWQGKINFEKVKESGVDFVMIRCGLRTSKDEIEVDYRFKENITAALDSGLKVGVYFFSTASTEIEALEEAKWVVDMIKDYDITYPVAYDMENILEFSTAHISLEQVNKDAKVFLDYINNNGYVGALYSNGYDLNYRWDLELLSNYLIWYAFYGMNPDYEGNYAMWQYSDTGRLKGVNENVDLNIAYFSYKKD